MRKSNIYPRTALVIAYLALGLCSQSTKAAGLPYQLGLDEPIQNDNAPAVDPPQPSGRSKRAGFVGLEAIPNMMRGFAHNIGRGFDSMSDLGHRMVSNVMQNMPTIIYGNWKPIYNTKPVVVHPQPAESSYVPSPQPVQTSYAQPAPVVHYAPAQTSYTTSAATIQSSYKQPQPTISYSPVVVSQPVNPTYVVPSPEPVYITNNYNNNEPTPGPVYIKPIIDEQGDSYGIPLSQPVNSGSPPSFADDFNYIPAVPAGHASLPVVNHNSAGGFFSTAPPSFPANNQVVISEIPEDYSQNPDHISHISEQTLFYKDVGKLKGKQKLVEGKHENFRAKVGPSLLVLRS